MQINKFIKTVFPTEDKIEIPKTIETKKLEKTWKKVITGLEKDYRPKTKIAESKVEKLKKDEERIDNEKLNIQRQKIQADNDLKQSKEEDKKILEKIIGKYRGDKLAKEIGRLNELPIESLILVGGKKSKKKSNDELIIGHGQEWVVVHPGVDEEVETPRATISDGSNGFDEVSDIQEEPSHIHHHTAASLSNDYFTTTLGNHINGATAFRVAEDEMAESKKDSNNPNKDLPYLVIFTKPLKTEKPDDEELKRYNGLEKIRVKGLGNKDIGRFIIIINLSDMSRNQGLKAFNLDLVADEDYDHACIHSGRVCLGSRADTYDRLAKNYQIFDMVDLVLDLLVSTTVSGPYIDWPQWFKRATKPTVSFTNKRIKNFFKGNYDDVLGSLVNGSISYSGIPQSAYTTPSESISPNGLTGYQGWDPVVSDTETGRRQMIEMEMRRHIEQTREAMERQRNQYTQLQSQMYSAVDPIQYGGGSGSGGGLIAAGGGGGGASQSPVDVSPEISAIDRLLGRQ